MEEEPPQIDCLVSTWLTGCLFSSPGSLADDQSECFMAAAAAAAAVFAVARMQCTLVGGNRWPKYR